MAGIAIDSPGAQALRQTAVAAIKSAVTEHQRLEQQKGWLMEIDSQTQENVEALRSQVKQLQSDADFSQQELESFKAVVNDFAARTQQVAETGRYVSQQAENEIGRLKEVAQQHVQKTRDHRQEILHLREAAEKQAYEL